MSEAVSEKAKAALREIGLTEYETRAYLCLLQVGMTTASRISESTGVPYSKIYEVLNSLEKKGWIETQASRPKRYYPKSPVEALEATRLRLENKMKGWRKLVLEELQLLYDKREIREKPDVWILRGEFDAIAKLKDLIVKAESQLMVAVPAFSGPLVKTVLPTFTKLLDTDVKVLIMMSRNLSSSLASLRKLGEVRVRDDMFGGGIIADGREAILILGRGKPSLIIWSDHLGLVEFAKGYFEYLWSSAEQI